MQRVYDMYDILRSNRRAFWGFMGLSFFFLMALLGPLVVSLDMRIDYESRFLPPSLAHPFGTDYAGRDILGQLVHGSTDVFIIAFTAAASGTFLAVATGFLAGLEGGWVDLFLCRIIDVLLILPRFPIMVILAALLPVKDSFSFGLVIALFSWPGLARSLRSQILTLKKREFIEVAQIMGLSRWHIIFKEMAPNLTSYISINFIEMARSAITASIGIMFLGLVPLEVTNWGMMLNLATFNTGAIFVPHALAYLLAPLFAVVAFQYCMVAFASGLDQLFDPRLKRSLR
jgi:peptide/nickel transport system permease protein